MYIFIRPGSFFYPLPTHTTHHRDPTPYISGNNHKSEQGCALYELHDDTQCHLCMLLLWWKTQRHTEGSAHIYLGRSVYIYKVRAKFEVCWHGTHITFLPFYCLSVTLPTHPSPPPKIHMQTHTEMLGMFITHEFWTDRRKDKCSFCLCSHINMYICALMLKYDNINSLAMEFLCVSLSCIHSVPHTVCLKGSSATRRYKEVFCVLFFWGTTLKDVKDVHSQLKDKQLLMI